MTLLLKSKQFGLPINLKMKVPKDLKIQGGRLMVGVILDRAFKYCCVHLQSLLSLFAFQSQTEVHCAIPIHHTYL